MKREDRYELARLREAATQGASGGVWQRGIAGVGNLVSYNQDDVVAVADVYSENSHALIVAMHAALPSLLADSERADIYRAALQQIAYDADNGFRDIARAALTKGDAR